MLCLYGYKAIASISFLFLIYEGTVSYVIFLIMIIYLLGFNSFDSAFSLFVLMIF